MSALRILAAGLALTLACGSAGAASPDCKLDPRAAPATASHFKGVVRGPATTAEVYAQTRIAIERTRAMESPAYDKMPRVFVYFVVNGARHGTIAAVVDGDMPKPGEAVTLASRHRDLTQPCAFAPWTVIRDKKALPTT